MSEVALPPPLRAQVRCTPLIPARALPGWLKLESLQSTGSFKIRGAARALARVAADGAHRVLTASAGNHGLGVAAAAGALGLSAMVYVPANAARIKREKIAALGATLVVSGADYDESERMARARAAQEHVPFVSPFDDADVIAGNGGSLARELLEQRPALRRIVVPVGGGGLVGGLLEALAGRGVEVVGVESAGACAMARSLAAGAPILEDHGETLCTGLDGGISAHTYAIATAHRLRVEVVPEEDILPAIAFAYRTLGQLIEPASATVIAAGRAGRVPLDDETVLVITGSNIDATLLDRALAS